MNPLLSVTACMALASSAAAQGQWYNVENSALAAYKSTTRGSDTPIVWGNQVLFVMDEIDQGNTDLNGDGDALDRVSHLYDLETGEYELFSTVWNLHGNPLRIEDDFFTAEVEIVDVNGDGDTGDRFLLWLETSTNTTHILGDAAQQPSVQRHGDIVVSELGYGGVNSAFSFPTWIDLSTGEQFQAPFVGVVEVFSAEKEIVFFSLMEQSAEVDINGDGDMIDSLDVVWWPRTGQVLNLGFRFTFDQRHGVASRYVIASVLELSFGDLNGDGDASDNLLWAYDLDSDEYGLIGSDGYSYDLGDIPFTNEPYRGDVWPFLRNECESGTDINGDGDNTDREVVCFIDTQTLEITCTGLVREKEFRSLQWGAVDGRRMAIPVNDGGVHEYDFGTRATRYLADGKQPSLQNGILTTTLNEYVDGVDLNGDGVVDDTVHQVFDLATGTSVMLGSVQSGRPRDRIPVRGRDWIAVRPWEFDSGPTDLNGDGDTDDHPLHIFDLARGELVQPIPAVYDIEIGSVGGNNDYAFGEDLFAVLADEGESANTDWNGDGDSQDVVLQIVRFTPAGGSETSYGAGFPGTSSITPQIDLEGVFVVEAPMNFQVWRGLGGAAGLLRIGTQSAQIPLFGGTLLVGNPIADLVIILDGAAGVPGAGNFEYQVAAVPSGLSGVTLYAQAAFLDAGADRGVSFTEGISVHFGAGASGLDG